MHQRPAALKAIIAYKFVKAPLMIALALALTFAADQMVGLARHLTAELSESGSVGWRISRWLLPHLDRGTEWKAALVAWLDGISTAVEGLLLLWGNPLGEWIVVAGLAALVPFEAMSLVRHPGLVRALLLLVNAAVVAYLAWRRLAGAKKKGIQFRAESP